VLVRRSDSILLLFISQFYLFLQIPHTMMWVACQTPTWISWTVMTANLSTSHFHSMKA